MTGKNPETLLRTALESSHPFDSAHELARRLRDQGMDRPNLEKLFREELERHREDVDDRKWDALADTLDFIVGWCSPGKELFPKNGKGD